MKQLPVLGNEEVCLLRSFSRGYIEIRGFPSCDTVNRSNSVRDEEHWRELNKCMHVCMNSSLHSHHPEEVYRHCGTQQHAMTHNIFGTNVRPRSCPRWITVQAQCCRILDSDWTTNSQRLRDRTRHVNRF